MSTHHSSPPVPQTPVLALVPRRTRDNWRRSLNTVFSTRGYSVLTISHALNRIYPCYLVIPVGATHEFASTGVANFAKKIADEITISKCFGPNPYRVLCARTHPALSLTCTSCCGWRRIFSAAQRMAVSTYQRGLHPRPPRSGAIDGSVDHVHMNQDGFTVGRKRRAGALLNRDAQVCRWLRPPALSSRLL